MTGNINITGAGIRRHLITQSGDEIPVGAIRVRERKKMVAGKLTRVGWAVWLHRDYWRWAGRLSLPPGEVLVSFEMFGKGPG